MKCSVVLILSGMLLSGASLGSFAKDGKVFTWTDSKGVVHYGEHPPKDVQAKLVKTRTGHSDPTPASATATSQASTAQIPNDASLKDPMRCTRAKQNLDVLNSGAPIRMQNENGETVIMDEEEKAKQRNISQVIINQAC
ncbi:MAG TPA: DUF4124 domain-containing protein [Cellvibrio sp.]|nr:DUF4124 domain-containing protein [Cellvibrio sp.]